MTKRLLISLLTLLCCSTGVWALDRDTENYYILSSLQDWQDFASLAQTVPTINARMIADINLGDDQTMIGSESVPYEGIFDGQGHKLTVAYSQAGITDGIGPFHAVGAATIQNLHVDGSMLTNCGIGGIAGIIAGNATIQRCWVSASMQSVGSKYTGTIGGFCSWCAAANCHLTIEDCLFDGVIVNNAYCGGFMSHVEQSSSSVTMRRGLNVGTYPTTTDENGTFVREVLSGVRNLETSTLFYKKVFKIAQGTQVTDDQLADGSITTTLQNDRAETVWVQDATSGQPRLDVFNHPVTTYDPYVHPTSQIINLSELTEDYIAQDGDVLTGTTGYSVQIAADATITLSDVTITNYRKSPIQCLGNATINIEDGSVNRLRDSDEDSNSYGRPALAFGPSGTTLTINGNTGRLIAIGGRLSSAIGCRDNRVAYGGLVINGGIISAHGNSSYTSGIGAVGADDSHGSFCGDITINGGTINAAASDGIGIGAGGPNSCGAITINGGTITSHAVRSIAIGGNCSKVAISGGDINASTTTSVGIGSSGVVYIEGGTIVASASGSEGVGISGDKGVLIRSSITSLTASKGADAANAIQGGTVYISANLNDVTEGNTRTLTPKASFDPDADIAQDWEGYYLIGSAQNWKEFAVVVIGTPTANAKMTADINLGDDQTMIGSYATRYSGIFDGQGHTLTFNYNTSSMSVESGQSYLGAAPFRDIEGATIRNVHTAGSITADKIGASGLVGWAYGTNTIENCWSDVNIASSNNTADTFTGFVAFMYGTSINITDCIFTGCIQSTCKKSHSGFIGYHYSGTSALTNCLVILDEGSDTNQYNDWGVTFFTFDRFAKEDQSTGSYTNCYYYRDFGVAQGTKATAAQLSDGTIAYKLQNHRGDLVWGQRIGTDTEPVLTNDESYRVYRSKNGGYTNDPEEAYEDIQQDEEGNYLIASVQNWQDFAEIVNGGATTANAKMTADIDLGDDQTMIGDNVRYSGVFDGQGHKLNVNYYSSETTVDGGYYIAPFRDIQGATIKNLTVTGNITGYMHCAGVAGVAFSPSTNLISNVTVSANITILNTHGGGLIGHNENATTTIQDCLFNGTINGKSGGSTVGVFFGWSGSATMSLINCLENGSYTNCSTFTPTSCPGYAVSTVTNCYYAVSGSYPGTHATSAQLADGTIAYKLQNNRGDLVWGQRIGTDAEPVLTNDENYRVYRSKNGGYTNDPEEGYEDIQQDGEGNYLLGCLSDWQDFAEIVNSGTNPAANAKMTADINLGDDQTKIGSFSGIFDGQGHTITINLSTTEQYVGLFCNITDATINNLHVTGAITTNTRFVGGMVGRVYGTSTIQNCWSSVDVTTTYGGDGVQGGMVGCVNGTLNISDCLYNGALNGSSAYTWGGFVGWLYGTTNISNCLFASDEINVGASYTATHVAGGGTVTNCYYKNVMGSAQGTQASTAQLADGTIATALQNGRAEEIWVQDPLTNQPMLAVFAGKYTVPASGLGTFSAKANFTLPEGLDAYYCKNYDASAGTIAVIAIDGVVPANTGVLLKGTPNETYTLTGTNETAATVTDNALVAVTEATHVDPITGDYTNFGLSYGVFKKVNSNGGTVKANRAYLHILTSELSGSPARGIKLVWNGDVTNIQEVQGSTFEVQGDNSWYTLSGLRLNGKPTTKGIYIINGKKIVIN